MAQCSKCKQRKAKRSCPALGSGLCNLCCGLLREKEIHCPAHCPYLVHHRPYQEKRILEKKQVSLSRKDSAENEAWNDERMQWLLFHIEAPLHELGSKNPAWTDREAVLALEYAKDKVEKGRSRLIVPGEDHKPKNQAGEAVLAAVDNCRYERQIILAGGLETYKKDEKVRALERIILTAKSLAKKNLEGRNYLQHVLDRFARFKDFSQKQKILTP
jgi:hypothetical protein